MNNERIDNDPGPGRVVTSGSSGRVVVHSVESVPAESRGLGDTIAKMTSAIGIKPCGGCKERQKKLNEKFPYRRGKK